MPLSKSLLRPLHTFQRMWGAIGSTTPIKLASQFSRSNRNINLLAFSLLAGLELALAIYLATSHRIPNGHDTLQEFMMRYYFLNSAVTTSDIPLWMPYMTQGTLANWWYFIQGGLLQNIAVAVGPLAKFIDFLDIYYLQVWLEHFILLLGTWLLSQRLYHTLTARVFVAIAVLASTIWFSQIWLNLRLIYAIPLILFLLDTYVNSGRFRHLLGASILFGVQWIGNLPYVIPLQALFILLYFLLQFSLYPQRLRLFLSHIRQFPLRPVIALCVVAAPLFWGATVLSSGTDWIVTYNPGRNPDGSTTFDMFRRYGGTFGLEEWAFLLLESSPLMGPNLFPGYLTVALAVFSIAATDRRPVFLFAGLAIFFCLFTTGAPHIMMRALYDWFPGMQYFRHVSFAAIYVKFAICILAGLGIDHLLTKESRGSKTYWALLGVALLLTAWAAWFALTWAGLSALVLVVIAFFIRKNLSRHYIVVAILAVHIPNLIDYKLSQANSYTTPLTASSESLVKFTPMPYIHRRCGNLLSMGEMNGRAQHLLPLINGGSGTMYWSTESFLFQDCLESPYRTDHFLLPLDQYMRVYFGQAFDDRQSKLIGQRDVRLPKAEYWKSWQQHGTKGMHPNPDDYAASYPYQTVRFPSEHLASIKIAGGSADKLQIFSNVLIVDSLEEVASIIKKPDYRGETLILSEPTKISVREIASQRTTNSVAVNPAPHHDYKILSFNPNQLKLELHLAMNQPRQWLLYSDVWHPFWKAWVNGKPAQIYRANLAYKAVQLDPGNNTVEFKISAPKITASYYGLMIYSVAAIAIIFLTLRRVGRTEPG